MRKGCCLIVASFMLLALSVTADAKSVVAHHRSHATLRHSAASGHKGSRAVGHTAAVAIPPERATAIQTALIKQGYLSGQPTGTWDPQTVAAMEKLQEDNGWQRKFTPDSRALIKLGLGPDTQHEELQAQPQ